MEDFALYLLIYLVPLAIFDIVIIAIARRHAKKMDKTREACTEFTTALVVSTYVDHPAWGRGAPRSCPILQFSADGIERMVKYPFGTLPNFKQWNRIESFKPKYSEGMQVAIAYDPTNPECVCILDDDGPYKLSKNLIITCLATTGFFAIVIIGCFALAA